MWSKLKISEQVARAIVRTVSAASREQPVACSDVGVADVTSTTVYTAEHRMVGIAARTRGGEPSPWGVDSGGESKGSRGERDALSEGVLDKGVVTVFPPNNKQATLTLICLFCPSLPGSLSRRSATRSFPHPVFARRSLSLRSLSSRVSFVFSLVSLHLVRRERYLLVRKRERLPTQTRLRLKNYRGRTRVSFVLSQIILLAKV